MANATTGIKNSWSLLDFAREFGKKMQVGSFVNKETGETWKSCIFSDGDKRTFVSFSPNLGELTPAEIKEQKDDLQVVECTTKNGDDMFSLCKKGQNSWEDVDLF